MSPLLKKKKEKGKESRNMKGGIGCLRTILRILFAYLPSPRSFPLYG